MQEEMRIMGLDVGSRTIGVAISDELGLTAQSLKTIRRKTPEDDWKELMEVIRQYEIGQIVVGLPRNMDGTMGKEAEKILKWISDLQARIRLPIDTWDERLSTVGANRILLEADLSRKKRKKSVDQLAAAIILQGFLEHSRHRKEGPHFSS